LQQQYLVVLIPKNFPPKLNSKGDTVVAKIKVANRFEEIVLQEKITNGSQGNAVAAQIKPTLTNTALVNGYIVLFCTGLLTGIQAI
jgi:hypothetical protein